MVSTALPTLRGLKIGIVGGGFMAQVHSVAARASGASLEGAVASSAARSIEVAAQLGVARGHADLDELLSSDIDVVHVCTPNASHTRIALAALAAGKHVVCEKPLAVTSAEAEEMVVRADAEGLVATVPFVYRFHPMAREARKLARSGQLGPISLIQGSYLQDWLLDSDDDDWRVDPRTGGTSRAFADIGSHLVDLVEFVSGHRITEVNAQVGTVHERRAQHQTVRTEDLAVVVIRTDRGALGTLTVSQVAPGRKNRLTFELSGGTRSAAFDQETPELLWVGARDGAHLLQRDPAFLSSDARRFCRVPAGHPQGYQDAFNAFVLDTYQAVLGRDVEGLPTFQDGLRAVRVTEAVLESARTGHWEPVVDPTAEACDFVRLESRAER